MTELLVALGAAVGAPARYLTDTAVRRRRPGSFPWGTLLVNVSGSFALGLLVGAGVGPQWAALLATGFCGAFTTWSTLAVDVVLLARDGKWWPAALDVGVSVAAGLVAVTVGVQLGGFA
jgi:CrcB protein